MTKSKSREVMEILFEERKLLEISIVNKSGDRTANKYKIVQVNRDIQLVMGAFGITAMEYDN